MRHPISVSILFHNAYKMPANLHKFKCYNVLLYPQKKQQGAISAHLRAYVTPSAHSLVFFEKLA